MRRLFGHPAGLYVEVIMGLFCTICTNCVTAISCMVASIRPHYGMFPLGTSTRCPNGPPYLQLEESLACESSLQHVSVRVLSGLTVHAIVECTLPSICFDSVIGRLNVLSVESLEISAQRYSCSVLQEACRPGTSTFSVLVHSFRASTRLLRLVHAPLRPSDRFIKRLRFNIGFFKVAKFWC
jgi:hypothetical protein